MNKESNYSQFDQEVCWKKEIEFLLDLQLSVSDLLPGKEDYEDLLHEFNETLKCKDHEKFIFGMKKNLISLQKQVELDARSVILIKEEIKAAITKVQLLEDKFKSQSSIPTSTDNQDM
jgi:hypothetical protein